MLSAYRLNLTELSTIERIILLGVLAIIVIFGIIDYFYQKNKKSDKN